jgi:Cupin-like domain
MGKPVIIQNAPSEQWQARSMPWTPDFLVLNTPLSMKISVKQSINPRFGWGCCQLQRMNMKKFFKLLNKPHTHAYYAGPLFALDELELDIDPSIYDANEVSAPPKQTSSDARQEQSDDDNDDESTSMQTLLWMGSQGAVAPLHHDLMHNFFVQIYGSKQFTLYPPSDWHNVYLFPKFHLRHRNSQIDMSAPDVLERFPRFKNTEPVVARLSEGDVLYLPPMWFHEVEALSNSISVNVWSTPASVHELRKAWDEAVPLDPIIMNDYEVMALTAHFIRRLAEELTSSLSDGLAFLNAALEARYEPLYGPKSHGPYPTIVKSVGLNQTVPATIDDLVEADAAVFVSMNPDSSTDSESDMHASGSSAEIDLDSPEGKQLRDYLIQVETEAPNFIVADPSAMVDKAKRRARKGRSPGASHDTTFSQSKRLKGNPYEAHKLVYVDVCSDTEVESYLRNPERKQELESAVERHMKVFDKEKHDQGVLEIMFANYIEDLMAQVVGENQVYSFLKSCVLQQSQ